MTSASTGTSDTIRRLRAESLSTSWLAKRRGDDPARIDLMRRRRELLGVRPPGTQDYLYPAWQFGRDGQPLPGMRRVLEAAAAAGIDDMQLYELMNRSVGLGGGRRLADVLRDGGDDHVVAAIAASRARAAGAAR